MLARAHFVAGVLSIATALPAAAQVAHLSTSTASMMPDARTVLIERASVPGDALIVVRPVRSGRTAPTVMGQIRLRAGETANVRVPLTRRAEPGEALLIALHADQGRIGVYDRDPVVLTVDIPETVIRAARR